MTIDQVQIYKSISLPAGDKQTLLESELFLLVMLEEFFNIVNEDHSIYFCLHLFCIYLYILYLFYIYFIFILYLFYIYFIFIILIVINIL